ncbi:5398_t:CDS:2, partial [Acaulospora colombiana]
MSILLDFLSHGAVILLSTDSPTLFVLATTLTSLGSSSIPSYSSTVLGYVRYRAAQGEQEDQDQDVGVLFGALAVLQSLGQTIVGPIIFGVVYSMTISWYPKGVFVLACGCAGVALLLMCIARPRKRLILIGHRKDRSTAYERGRWTCDLSATAMSTSRTVKRCHQRGSYSSPKTTWTEFEATLKATNTTNGIKVTNFGKKILSERVPGWFEYYLDYKALKKIISSVHASPDPSAAFKDYATDFEMAKEEQKASSVPKPSDGFRVPSTTSVQPLWESTEPLQPTGAPLSMTIAVNSAEYANRDPDFQMKKAAFFFKLQRELDKINAFYLKKEAELKLRIIALLSKRQAAASRTLPDSDEREMIKDHVEWQAVEEGFTLLQNDLSKLQQFVDINATGFRKILKKWDKRSKSTTKELYLARQVEVQPVFNRQLITEFSDVVAACLLNLTDTTIPLSATLREELSKHDSVLNAQLMREPLTKSRVFLDLEDSLRRAVVHNDVVAVQQALVTANELTNATDGRTYVSRILWKCAVEAEPELADLILDSPNSPCDFKFIDDINGRTSIHEAAAAGAPRLIDRCIVKGVEVNKRDSYGRTALHYAVIEGHPESVDRLLAANADPTILDLDNFSCLYYAVVFGQLDSVRLLFRTNGPGLRLAPEGSDIDLLSLACLHGHYDIALLLLDQGANQVPNSNGQYPIHLAAGAGHAEICQLLTSRARETLDIPDKYNEWTPLFHAAQKGRTPSVKVLLEAGCDTTVTDELGRTPIFYAGWYGHIDCVELLLSSSRKHKHKQRPHIPEPDPKQVPEHQLDGDLEADNIPSLSLPPPIMPFRIYGHNYLDKQYLVQLTLGRPHSHFYLDQQDSPVKITAWESNLSTIPPNSRPKSLLKMIMTSRPETAAVPVNLTIPLSEERDVISFQVQDLSELALEFSFYPLFGSKTVGRAAVLPSAFENIKDSRTISLAILDHRLHIIGQATFEACIIRPFTGVTLQFGGAVDTYWKSSSHLIDKAVPSALISPPSALDSTHTSPSNRSAIMNPSGSITISSLSRDQ